MKVALIGHGHLGRWHADKINQLDVEFYSIIELDKAKHDEIKNKFPNLIVTHELESVIEQVDAFIVATPTKYHKDVLVKLLRAKKNIFCEKPMCSNSSEVIELESLYDDTLVLQVGHSERFHNVWSMIEEHNPESASSMNFSRKAPFKGRATDVGVIQDLMIHDVDLMIHLKKEMPVSVFSFGEKVISDYEDVCCALFEFSNGTVCKIEASRIHFFEERISEICFPNKKINIDLMNNTIQILKPGEDNSSSYEKRDHLLEEQKCFYESIRKSTAPIIGFKDAKQAIQLLDAIAESYKTKKKVMIGE